VVGTLEICHGVLSVVGRRRRWEVELRAEACVVTPRRTSRGLRCGGSTKAGREMLQLDRQV